MDQLEKDFINSETKRIRNANIFGVLAGIGSLAFIGWVFVSLY
jgi:hypothetical protein